MNTTSLNNLWGYLQGLTLTASNKRWLADHLYESAQMNKKPIAKEEKSVDAAAIRKKKEKALWRDAPVVSKDDMTIAPWVEELVKDVKPMSADADIDQIKLDYLMKKYG